MMVARLETCCWMVRSPQLGCRTLLIIISARLAAAENLNEIGASQLRLHQHSVQRLAQTWTEMNGKHLGGAAPRGRCESHHPPHCNTPTGSRVAGTQRMAATRALH